MRYEEVTFWPGAFHVFKQGQRVGIVNSHTLEVDGHKRDVWFAHNKHFFSVGGRFGSRAKAASSLNTKPIHHDSNVFK